MYIIMTYKRIIERIDCKACCCTIDYKHSMHVLLIGENFHVFIRANEILAKATFTQPLFLYSSLLRIIRAYQ